MVVMRKVGLIDLDTSHAEAFASVLDGADAAEVTAVRDGGRVRDEEYLQEFCDTYGATPVESPDGMVGDVDAVMVLTVDWDSHCELALPYLEAASSRISMS